MDEQKDVSLESDTEQTNIENEVRTDPSDQLTPEHPRFKEVLERAKTAEAKAEDLQSQIDDLNQKINDKQDTGEDTDEDEKALRVIEKRMASKFATKDDLNSDRQALQFDRLSEKYNGSNGYPKFVPVDVVAYSKRRGISSLEDAYYVMHRDAIAQVDAGKMSTIKAPTSEKPTGGDRQTESTVLSPQDIANMSDEEYEKHRTKILSQARPK